MIKASSVDDLLSSSVAFSEVFFKVKFRLQPQICVLVLPETCCSNLVISREGGRFHPHRINETQDIVRLLLVLSFKNFYVRCR